MRIGMVDVDNHERLKDCFPNLALMKLSAWHKSQGDTVEWCNENSSGMFDKVYLSKVFSFSPDITFDINAREIARGGSGYCIHVDSDGIEHFDSDADKLLPYDIEHMMPDYSIYFDDENDFKVVNGRARLTKVGKKHRDTAYGYMSRGCPRGCDFCIVKDKPSDGRYSHKVADLSEFWSGQNYIQLYDPNTLACKDWKDILTQLAESKAHVEFNQGVDIRMMTEEKAEYLRRIKIERVHFAYDRYEDKKIVEPRLKQFKEVSGFRRRKVMVYVLINFNSTIQQDLERIMFIRSLDFTPYCMIYNKSGLKRGDIHFKLARWVNFPAFFWGIPTFEEYLAVEKQTHGKR